jgi:uncharacterized Ntn-hydrolase superfamily protein
MIPPMTFSIVAADMAAEGGPEWGVAVASKFLAVGSAVPWARAVVGAVATQAFANLAYGPDGLALLEEGRGAGEVTAALTGADPDAAHRQLGVVDRAGRAATFTGEECLEWAGGVTGSSHCCQGNILASPEVVSGMSAAFEGTRRPLADRLMAAVVAGYEAGGDRRGMQSAALLVVREGGGYMGGNDRAIDLRVDDHTDAVHELVRLVELHRLYFPPPDSLEFLPLDDELAAEVRGRLRVLGSDVGEAPGYDDALRHALFAWVGAENLEERWSDDARIDRTVLEHLRRSAP